MRIDDGKVEFYKKSIIIDALIYLYVFAIHIFTYRAYLNAISNALFLVLAGSMLYYLFFKCNGGRVYFDRLLGIYTIFFAICLLSVTYAQLKDKASERVRTLFLIGIMIFLLYNYLVNTKNDKILIYAILIGGIGYCIYIPAFYGFEEYNRLLTSGERIGTEIANVNSIGMNISIVVSICMYLALYKKKRYMYIILALPLYIALGTGSRTALISIAFIVFSLIFMYFIENQSASSFVKIIVLLFVVFAIGKFLLGLPMFETLSKRLEEGFNLFTGGGKVDHSAILRNNMIKYGFKEFKESILFGHGANNSAIVTLKHFGLKTYLHNNYVELLYTVGLLGFLAYYSIYFYLIKSVYKLFRKRIAYSEIFLVDLFAYLLMDYGTVSYYHKEIYIFFTAAAVFTKIHSDDKIGELLSDGI